MAKKTKSTDSIETGFQTLEQSISKTEQFIEKHQKKITIVAIAILVVVALVFAYKKFYLEPQIKEAQEQIFVAQQYFERDSMELCLNGDGENPGMLQIIEDYGSTPVANLAEYYAGVAYYKLGKYEDAVEHLSDFSTGNELLESVTNACIGDSYVELKKFDKAAGYYEDAAETGVNDVFTPTFLMKLGLVYEELGKKDKALKVYKKIKQEYKNSQEGRSIDKYIARLEM
ncbi:MAG: hypothetical protein CSB06_00015 [Bacteroidia bacterium]|nr:MAG: hypothetical protein CSB06_00015 [Bacteroidia bacterium]